MSQPEFSCSVVVKPLPEQSDADAGRHAFAYTITIRNTGDVAAQLIARHWVVTDARGRVDEVRGLAVVVVDGGVGEALTHLRVRALQLVDQALDLVGHGRRVVEG